MNPSAPILLATLNAKYPHASLGLRYLLANMGELRGQTLLQEFSIAQKPSVVVEQLLAHDPAIVGLGVYIWNVSETTQVVRLLKAVRPDVKLVLGGPEVSHEVQEQEICRLADHVITGWGDLSFARLCRALLQGPPPLMKVIAGEQPPLAQIRLPYDEYTDVDLAQRLLYVEASRGCPFKCEFCLSSLDKTAWAFELDAFLLAMQKMLQRGARQFKFVDRTFNLKVESSARILEFFLSRWVPGLFLHFEMAPDALPDRLKDLILQFPPGVLQFEVGIQSFDPQVQQRISRKQDHGRTVANLRWLVQESPVHVHADLIFGLPGETLEGFGRGFDQLCALGPHEIQVGILKRLRGTPITRHSEAFAMVYDPSPPYALLQSVQHDFAVVQRMQRFARYWDLLGNSGRFRTSLPLLTGRESAFFAFLGLSDWLWQHTGKTHEFSSEQLLDSLFVYLTEEAGVDLELARARLGADYLASGARGKPRSLTRPTLRHDSKPGATRSPKQALRARRARHEDRPMPEKTGS